MNNQYYYFIKLPIFLNIPWFLKHIKYPQLSVTLSHSATLDSFFTTSQYLTQSDASWISHGNTIENKTWVYGCVYMSRDNKNLFHKFRGFCCWVPTILRYGKFYKGYWPKRLVLYKETTGGCRQWKKKVNCLTCLWLELLPRSVQSSSVPVKLNWD